MLANIYFAIFTLVSSSQLKSNKDVREYLGLSAALMHHWKTGWRGYNKNSKQGEQLYELIVSTLKGINPEISSKADIEMILNMCHEKYYETALIMEIYPINSNNFLLKFDTYLTDFLDLIL